MIDGAVDVVVGGERHPHELLLRDEWAALLPDARRAGSDLARSRRAARHAKAAGGSRAAGGEGDDDDDFGDFKS